MWGHFTDRETRIIFTIIFKMLTNSLGDGNFVKENTGVHKFMAEFLKRYAWIAKFPVSEKMCPSFPSISTKSWLEKLTRWLQYVNLQKFCLTGLKRLFYKKSWKFISFWGVIFTLNGFGRSFYNYLDLIVRFISLLIKGKKLTKIIFCVFIY